MESSFLDPEEIELAWTKQKADGLVEKHFSDRAPLRLRALQKLNSAHFAVDISALVMSDDGPVHITSRSWT